MKRSQLKPARKAFGKVTNQFEQRARDDWRTWAGMQGCAVCGGTGRNDGHHVIEAQELRNRHRADLMWDRRNALPLCRDCHGAHHAYSRRVLLSELRPENLAFANELDLVWLIRRTYAKDEAA